jgi:hypothetical protein
VQPADETGWLLRTEFGQRYPPVNQTSMYEGFYDQAQEGKSLLPASAKTNTQFILVPGMNHDLHRAGQPNGYMTENLEALRENGFDAAMVLAPPRGLLDSGREVLKGAFDEAVSEGKRIVAYGHSVGGVRIADFLQTYPEYKDDVDFVVYDKSPIAGSDIAQAVENHPFWRGLIHARYELEGGDGESIAEMTYPERQKAIAQKGLPADVPSVAIVGKPPFNEWTGSSSPADFTGSFGEGIARGIEWESKRSLAGDGRLLKDDGKLPGGWYAEEEGMSHLDGNIGGVPEDKPPLHPPSGPINPRSHVLAMLSLGYARLDNATQTPKGQLVPEMAPAPSS